MKTLTAPPVLYIVFGLALIIVFGTGFYIVKNKKGTVGLPQVSPDVLFLTSPVTSFSGKVSKVAGNRVWITQKYTYSAPMVIPAVANTKAGTPAPIPTPVTREITREFIVGDNTVITQPPVNIPYLLITTTPAPPLKLTIANLKIGQNISVNTNTDLRTGGESAEATSVNLSSVINTFSGRITKIAGDTFTVIAPSIQQPGAVMEASKGPSETSYTVKVTDATEISRYGAPKANPSEGPAAPSVEKMSLKDLEVGTQVTVYTDKAVTVARDVVALRVEPAMPLPTMAPQPTVVMPTALPTIAPTEVTLPSSVPSKPATPSVSE